MGRRVVSVSKTPGHTKHFQTIFISPSVRLCDCPGLVFPSMVPRPFQVVLGSYPISQVREPYSVVQLLAERLDLPKLLKLEARPQWTTYDICEAWAGKQCLSIYLCVKSRITSKNDVQSIRYKAKYF